MTLYQHLLAWIHWDPPRFAFVLPIVNRPVAWYGIFFALGFVLGFFLIIPIIKRRFLYSTRLLPRDVHDWPLLISELKKGAGKSHTIRGQIFNKLSKQSQDRLATLKVRQEPEEELKQDIIDALSSSMVDAKLQLKRDQLETLFPKALNTAKELAVFLTDRMTWFVIIGTIIGARLGHVFFYDWPRYKAYPLDIFRIWEGGLASHGGTIGIMLALLLFVRTTRRQFPEFTFLTSLDILCIPTALAAVFIRIGNFFNQEIYGPPSTVPWAIIFGHPFDGALPLPRHPAQLYEAIAYLCTFLFLYTLWKAKGERLRKGTLVGLFMVCVFGSRFIIEFVKTPQSLMIDETYFSTGQYLSIPFILLGLGFLFRQGSTRCEAVSSGKSV